MNSLIDLNNLTFNDKKITVVLDDNNEPWFKAIDIAVILEYSNVKKAIQMHVSEKYKTNLFNIFGPQNITMSRKFLNSNKSVYINETGVYELIFSSKLPIAINFKEWIFENVLPTIRKYGEYKLNFEMQKLSENFNKQLELKDEQIHAISASNKCLKNFVDNINFRNRPGYIYIATCKQYMLLNTFKVGKTYNPKIRLAAYNINRTVNDRFFYIFIEKVYNPIIIENHINVAFRNFKDKKNKEIIILFYDYIYEFIQILIKNNNEEYKYMSNLFKHKISTMHELKPRILPEINIENLETE